MAATGGRVDKEKPMFQTDNPLSPATGRHPSRGAEDGITTAEYAVGTAAGAGLAGLLFKLLTGGFGEQLLHTLFDHVLGLLGIG